MTEEEARQLKPGDRVRLVDLIGPPPGVENGQVYPVDDPAIDPECWSFAIRLVMDNPVVEYPRVDPRNIERVVLIEAKPRCTCDSFTMAWRGGCTCGAMERERRSAGRQGDGS